MKNQRKIEVAVFDFKNQPVRKAEVVLTSQSTTLRLEFNKYSGTFTGYQFLPDRYHISVLAGDLGKQERTVFIGSSGAYETFILGKEGMPHYYRGNVKVPFEPIGDEFGIVLLKPDTGEKKRIIPEVEKKFGIKVLPAGRNFEKNGLFIFKYPENLRTEEEKQKLRSAVLRMKSIQLAAPVLRKDERNASLLTNEIIVRFKGHVERQQVGRIAKEFGLVILRNLPYAGNAWQMKYKTNGFEILDVCERLVDTGLVEYAEPNLFHTFEEDAIIPNNYLYPEQWDHPLINTPDAWQVLNDHPGLGAAQRFGSPDIIVAVVDSGVNTAHPHFNGNVSNGQPKIFSTFDFQNMVANNNSLGSSHGTCCAGAAVGYTTVSSGGGGVPDGTVGIAGNCRLMCIRRGGTEADYADMYIWVGGFNPNSTRPGFPAALARGADVITSSYGSGFTAPIAGVMKDAFDHLTTYGRNGKGIILAFSVGNYASNINFHMLRPWAAYPKTFACGASSLANDGITEIISAYSGSGTLLDFCIPSHDAYVGDFPRHNPPQNYGALSATVINGVSDDDGNMPRNRQLQTTLSANAAAGASSVTVASSTGMANSQAIFIGNPMNNISTSEAKRITGIAGNTISFTPSLFAAKTNGTVVNYGNRDYKNTFGGTSYSTPVCAGIAALMLSVNNRLTWMEVREILRSTATKIDPNNTDPVGRWTDIIGLISTQPGYAGPFFSPFFGYGRLNAAAAVEEAGNYTHERDVFIRDNMADDGTGTTAAPFWEGVDIWVRNANDGVEPVNYAANAGSVHQTPIAGQPNWLNIRIKSRGTDPSFPCYVRAYIAHWPGTEFVYPDHFIPTVRPNGVLPNPLTFGTYLIGEQLVNPLNAGDVTKVVMEWTEELIPPKEIIVSGIAVAWHPCLLVEITPHDGFVPTGNHVWDDNNLAQKNISIDYGDTEDCAVIIVTGSGSRVNAKRLRTIIVPEPPIELSYFVFFPKPEVNKTFIEYVQKNLKNVKIGKYRKNIVVWVTATGKTTFDLPYTGLTPLIIGLGAKAKVNRDFRLNLLQYAGKNITGSYGLEFRKR